MEDTNIFYWFTWISWTWVTWMMNKSSRRTRLAIMILLAIIFSSYSLDFFHLTVHLGIIYFLSLSIYLLAAETFFVQVYLCLMSIIIALGYTALLVFSIYDPVWLIVSLTLVTTVYLSLVCSIFAKKLSHRLLLLILSTAMGETGLGLILDSLGLFHEIGTNGYLTRLTWGMVAVLSISAYKQTVLYMERFVQKLKNERRNVHS